MPLTISKNTMDQCRSMTFQNCKQSQEPNTHCCRKAFAARGRSWFCCISQSSSSTCLLIHFVAEMPPTVQNIIKKARQMPSKLALYNLKVFVGQFICVRQKNSAQLFIRRQFFKNRYHFVMAWAGVHNVFDIYSFIKKKIMSL